MKTRTTRSTGSAAMTDARDREDDLSATGGRVSRADRVRRARDLRRAARRGGAQRARGDASATYPRAGPAGVAKAASPYGPKAMGLQTWNWGFRPGRIPFFQSGSVGKQFTATAVMMLVEDGKIGLEDPLTRYFAEAPAWWRQVTVRQLLSHTAGFTDYPRNSTSRRTTPKSSFSDRRGHFAGLCARHRAGATATSAT